MFFDVWRISKNVQNEKEEFLVKITKNEKNVILTKGVSHIAGARISECLKTLGFKIPRINKRNQEEAKILENYELGTQKSKMRRRER